MNAITNAPMHLARGSWQRDVLRAMLTPHGTMNPVSQLAGRAKSYSMRYSRSLDALLRRAATAGYRLDITPGPRGGAYSAIYRLVKDTR